MAIVNKLQVFDEQGNLVDYDILASDVKFNDGKDLPTKLGEMEEEIGEGGYTPPAGGIPKTDLAQSVQDTLDDVADKVDKVAGKGLSTNDYTTEDKTKLGNLPTNPVQSISVNGQTQQKDTNGNVNVVVPTVVLDDAPTAGSPNGVKSGGVRQAIDEKLSQVTVNAIPAGSVAIIDDLTIGGSTNALSAEQGKLLDERVEELELGGGGGVSVFYNASTKTTNIVVGAGASAETTPTPVISVTDAQDGKQVTITAATGAVIRYTTDGSDPTSSSPVYSGPITINTAGTHTIKAVAKVSGKLMSEVATETVTLAGTEQPTITTSETASAVTVTATLADATVYISTDGENWTSGSGSASLTINKTTSEQQVTVYAYAKASGMIASQTVTQSVTVAELPNNKLSGTASAAVTAITINGTTYTNTQSATDPYIVNTQNGGVYDWEIDFGSTVFSESIKSGTSAKSIFLDGSTDKGNTIKSITHMPSSWSAIGSQAFYMCNNLSSLSIGSTITSIGENAFFGIAYNNGASMAKLTIPDTVQTVSQYAFKKCARIQSIYVGAGSIGKQAFEECLQVTSVEFGPNVASISTWLFLTGALSSLHSATFRGTTPPTFSDQNLFGGSQASDFAIYVPAASVDAYKTALPNWAEKITAITE